MFSGRNQPVVGLDIGSHSIKAILLEGNKSGLVLKSLGVANLPPEAIIEGNVEEREIVVAAIKNLIKSLKLKARHVSTSISGYSVIIKKISLPTQTREELAENIEVEAEQFIPFDISEVNVDFQIVGQGGASDSQMEVILAAAKKDVVSGYMGVLEEASLKPKIIDVDVFALENAFTYNYPDEQATIGLVDIGANKMNINIIKNGMSLLTKDSAIGGARITGEIQDRFDVDYQTAEAIKIGGMEAPDQAAVEEIVSRAVGNWAGEVRRAVDFMEASYPGEKLKGIYLSGGSCRLQGLSAFFQKQLGVATRHFNPFAKIAYDQSKFDPAYIEYMGPQACICLGLALRRGEEI
jgi:type IV pilus assembly protein PilM